MFQLQPAPSPAWLDVADGIRLLLKPVGTEALSAGRRAVRAALAEDENADTEFAFVFGCVAWGATAWEGIGDADGKVLDYSAEALGRLLQQRPDIYRTIDAIYIQPLMDVLSEKKGSSPSPTGTSGAARPTARVASSSKAKSAKPAPTPKTKSAAKPAPASGRRSKAAPAS